MNSVGVQIPRGGLRTPGHSGRLVSVTLLLLAVLLPGCGNTLEHSATEQLLQSEAVDKAIASIDFRALEGQSVYFDTSYLKNFKGIGFVNAEYVVSSMRQQMIAAGCLLQEKKDDADFIVEARIGTLGSDKNEVVYGIPKSNPSGAISAAASAVGSVPPIPSIPELALARKADQLAAAKVGAFAYHRESGRRVWQSGLSVATSTAKDTWLLGAGPFQSGTIYDGPRFAGSRIEFPIGEQGDPDELQPIASYRDEVLFEMPSPKRPEGLADESEADGEVKPASAEVERKPKKK